VFHDPGEWRTDIAPRPPMPSRVVTLMRTKMTAMAQNPNQMSDGS
jgi:hypothetical protein